jgi:hypothetical protein
MVAYVFDSIITKGVRAGQVPGRTVDARNWFRNAASRSARAGAQTLISKNSQKQVSDVGIGEMALFVYDANTLTSILLYLNLKIMGTAF